MSPDITIQLTPDAEAAVKRLENLPASMLRKLARALNTENDLTVGYIQEHKLSERGPTTLGVISDRLRSSVRRADSVIVNNTVVSGIGTNVVYAGVHEFGIDEDVTVKEHTRKTATRFSIDNDRTTVTRSAAERLGLLTKSGKPRKGKAKEVAGHEVTVREHTRHMKFPARAMFRTGIEERKESYSQALSQAVIDAAKGAQ